MEDEADFVKALLDDDGPCRDVNSEAPTWAGVGRALDHLLKGFATSEATATDDGADLVNLGPLELVEVARGGRPIDIRLVDGTGPLARMSVFVAVETDGQAFLELTFFPADLQRTPDLGVLVADWGGTIRTLLGAKRAFLRYENASWKMGDVGGTSGVFLVL